MVNVFPIAGTALVAIRFRPSNFLYLQEQFDSSFDISGAKKKETPEQGIKYVQS